jgi:nucleoside-diphosphate-sugar epimerase
LDRVVVTGGSGKAGRAVTRELVDTGYDVLNVDLVPTPDPVSPFLAADLTKLGEVFECLDGADAVVHLAAIPAPGLRTEAETFEINTMSTYHVFTAACSLGLSRVVWASSETVLGLPFEREQPDYLPLDEGQTPFPQSSYALSKLLGESMAAQCSRRFGVPFVGLRFSNIMEEDDYGQFPGFWDDPNLRKWNVWGYVDARDVAAATRFALEAETSEAEIFIVAAADTVMNRPSAELAQAVYPEVPVRRALDGYETLLSIDKARDLLGYRPSHSWRDHILRG